MANLRIVTIYACVFLCLTGRAAHSQGAAPAKPPAWLAQPVTIVSREYTFKGLLKAISSATGRTILADGEPLKATITEGFSGSAREVLDKAADRFDFSWVVNSRNTILLNKRFHDSDDIPQTHLPEMQRMGKDIMTALDALHFDSNVTHDKLILNQLYNSLSPQQKEVLANRQPLKFQDVSAEQAEVMKQAIMNNAASALYSVWDHVSQQLMGVPTSSLYTQVYEALAPNNFASTTSLYDVCFLYRNYQGKEYHPVLASQRLPHGN